MVEKIGIETVKLDIRLVALRSLNPIRGLAAVGVAIGHMFQVFILPLQPALALYASLLSQASLMIFFVISGYSIAHSAKRSIEDPSPIRVYVVSRFARIMPPLLFAFFLMFCLSQLSPYLFFSGTSQFIDQPRLARSGLNFALANDFGALLFLNGVATDTPNSNGPLWSLSFEVWLYALYFMTVIMVHRKQYFWLLAPAAAFAFLSNYEVNDLFWKYSLVWLAGAGVYLFHDKLVRHSCAVLLVACLTLLALFYFGYQFIHSGGRSGVENYNLGAGFLFSSVIALFSNGSILSNLSASDTFRRLTDSGYTLYLTHFPVFLVVFGTFQQWMGSDLNKAFMVGVLALLATIGAAVPLATLLENKSYFVRRINQLIERRFW